MIVRWKGAIPPAASSRRTEGTCRPITRISSFAGRVTEAALHRKVKPGAERAGLWPAVARNDVFRRLASPAWRQKVQVETASRGSRRFHALAKAIMPNAHPRLARSITGAAKRVPQGANERCVARRPPYPATDRRWVHPRGDEGATRRVALHRSAAHRTKAGRGRRDTADDHSSTGDPARDPPSRCEDTRVRECDLIMRCVASPPRCPSDRHRPPGATRVSVWLSPRGSRGSPIRASATQRAKAPRTGVAPYRSRDAR
jgi:hypothetical protein